MSDSPASSVLLDLSRDKVALLDGAGRFRYLNAAVEDLLGFEADDLLGTSAFDLVHPDDAERVRTAFEAVVAGDAVEPIEYRYATADGDWVWLRTRISPPSETGLDGYAVSSRDVTLEVESRRRLETIAATSTDVLWMFDADWSELLFVNDAVERVFGIERADLERRPTAFLDAVYPDDRPCVERAMERLSAGEPTSVDYRIGAADGPTRWVRVPSRPVIEAGDVVAVTGFARDVTDEYRRERQLTVMDNLLRHTIRNDMNVVDGTAERIADRVAEATADDAEADVTAAVAADLLDHAETIRRVADDLLTTAEKQRGIITLIRRRESPKPIDVAPLIEAAVDEALVAADGAVADVSVSCPDEARAFTHPELDYAIAELVENAIEHAERAAAVEVEVSATGDSVEIAVRDNAPPIPPSERYPVTDRWEMDDVRHTAGMGLWLVYWIADRSGGELAFDVREDGNEVTIAVPDAECDPGVDDPPSDASVSGPGPNGADPSRRTRDPPANAESDGGTFSGWDRPSDGPGDPEA